MEDSVQQDRIPNGIQVGSKRKTEEQESSDNNRDHSHTKETKQKSKKIKDSIDKKEEELGNHNSELATIEDKREGRRKRKNRQDSEGHVELSSEEKEIHTEQNIEPKNKKKKKEKKKSPIENEEGSVINHENGGGELITEKNKRRHQSSNKEAINDLSEDNASGVVGDTIHSTEKDDQTLLRTVENEVLNRANGHGEQPFAKFQKNATPPAFVRRCSAKTPRTEPRRNSNLKVGNNIFFFSVK